MIIATTIVLSIEEKRLLLALTNLNHDSIWGTAIRNVCKDPDGYRFRKLISELKSQAADEPSTMKNILGKHIYQQLMEL